MPADLHGDRLTHPSADHVPHTARAQVVEDRARAPRGVAGVRPRHTKVADLVPGRAPGVDEDPAEHPPEPDLKIEVLAEFGDEVGGEVGAARVAVLRLLEREGAGLEVDVPALEGEDFPAPPRQRVGDAAAPGRSVGRWGAEMSPDAAGSAPLRPFRGQSTVFHVSPLG